MKKLIVSAMSFKFNEQKDYFFHNANITFESGKIYFVQGKNGVGKSTFFSILQGTTPHDAVLRGVITFDNKEYIIQNNEVSSELSGCIKTMVQDCNKMLVSNMTVEENLKLAQLPYYPRLKPLAYSAVVSSIKHNFTIDVKSLVQQLSGGQKQILAIIMTLQKPTQVLLLDEPTAALDDKNSAMVMEFLDELTKQLNLIVIIITHDKELVESYAQHHTIVIKKEDEETRSINLFDEE